MNYKIPQVIGWVLIICTLLSLFSTGALILMSGWGVCGDNYLCAPAIGVVLEEFWWMFLLAILADIGLIMTAICNFKFSNILKRIPGIKIPTSYYVLIVIVAIPAISGLMNFFPYYKISRMFDSLFFVSLLSAGIPLIIVSIYFLRIIKKINNQSSI